MHFFGAFTSVLVLAPHVSRALWRFKSLFFLPLLLVCFLKTPGEAFADPGQSRFLARVWRADDGLPSNGIRAVVQAADGWIWVATMEGLVRFDGMRFSGFQQEPDASLAELPVRALFAMPDGDVWVNALRGGLFRWHDGRLREIWPDDDPAVPKPAKPNVDYVVSDGDGGAVIVHGAEVWLAKSGYAPAPIKLTPKLSALIKANGPAVSDSAGAFRELHDRQGRLWRAQNNVITMSRGGKEEVRVPVPELSSTTLISDIYEDREANIWVATRDGLIQVYPRSVEVINVGEGLASHAVRAVLEDSSGALWVSSRGGGFGCYNTGQDIYWNIDNNKHDGREIMALCEDGSGGIWAATNVGSIMRVTRGGSFTSPVPAVPGLKVAAMVKDLEGRMWLAGGQGVLVWDGAELLTCKAPVLAFCALALDAQGTVWAGTRNGLVFRSRDLALERVGSVPTSRGISGLLPDSDGSLWISTLGGGLHHLVGERCFKFSAENGLPDSRLTCVLDDNAGNAGRLWIGSLGGIFAVSKSELRRIESGLRKTAHWLELDKPDGMLTSGCVGGPQPAGWKGRDGLYFATANGLAHVRPEKLIKNLVAPEVALEQISVNGRLARLTGEVLEVGPGRTRLEFNYTGLSFTAPEKVLFRVLLEGFESEWQEMGYQRRAVYDPVPPGKYRFRVVATNRDGIRNKTGATVAVEVLPQFWERTSTRIAAATLAVLLAIAVGAVIARVRLNRRLVELRLQSAREAERLRIAQDLHDDLGASLTHISLFANMAAERERDASGSSGVLPEIALKAQALVGALDEIVWAANPRYDTLASTAEYLVAFASELLAAAKIALRLEMPAELPAVTLDADRRHCLFLAAREALNNAAKHSHAKEVQLRLSFTGTQIQIAVEDNGRGFDLSDDSHGDGLGNLRERLARLGGSCLIESTPGVGSRVLLTLSLAGSGTALP